jgi:hypothetical protein
MEMPTVFEEYNIIVSAELLRLLQWILEQEQDLLKSLIKKALHDPHSLREHSTFAPTTNEDMKEQITQFFAVLDALIQEVNQEEAAQQDFNHLLVPAIHHVDVSQCNQETIAKSINKLSASSGVKTSPEAKEIFCRALLRNWTPQSDKQTVN